MGGCLISSGSGVLVRVRRDPHGDDEGVYSIPSPARPAPPMSSSATTALSRRPLVRVLRNVADPRDRRGARHDLPTVLSLAVAGVLAGARSLTAIWEHTTDLTGADLRSLGLEEGWALPSESTIRRVLQDLEPAGLDAHLASWLWTRTGTINGRRVIAVDGKTMRGARAGEDPAPHLLAALDHATGAVLTQERVAGKTNEIPTLPELLEPLDLDGVVVTADATAHPGGHRPVDHPARWPLPPDGQGQPEDPAQDAQSPALEGRPVHLLGRHLSRSAGAAHCQSPRGAPVGGLPRRRPGAPGPTHPHHQRPQGPDRWRWST